MIVLDTNVLSEFIRPSPDTNVLSWLDSRLSSDVTTTAITAGELLYGVNRLPSGRRKTALAEAVRRLLTEDLHGRVAPFDAAASEHCANIRDDRERLGRPIGIADAQIAAICRARKATLATRNTTDFVDTGVDLVDPWQSR